MAKTPKFEFDAALSFAGEDRRHAEAIARALQEQGLKVFYDRDYAAHLWGKGQEEYEKIYGPASRYVIPLVSKHYREKDWTRLEFGIAKKEARRRRRSSFSPSRSTTPRC